MLSQRHIPEIAEHIRGAIRGDIADACAQCPVGQRLHAIEASLSRIETTLELLVGQVKSFNARLTAVEGRPSIPPPLREARRGR